MRVDLEPLAVAQEGDVHGRIFEARDKVQIEWMG